MIGRKGRLGRVGIFIINFVRLGNLVFNFVSYVILVFHFVILFV